MSLANIVDELADALAASMDDADFEILVHSGMLFNPSGTAIDVYPDDPFRDEDTAGHGDVDGGYRFLVRARTGLNDLDSGQQILLALMDDENDYAPAVALADERTLNGYAHDVYVSQPTGFRPFADPGGGTQVGVLWSVLVLAAHS